MTTPAGIFAEHNVIMFLKIRTHSFGFDLVLLSTRFDSVLWLAI
jgi:hypothetical protein